MLPVKYHFLLTQLTLLTSLVLYLADVGLVHITSRHEELSPVAADSPVAVGGSLCSTNQKT